MSKKTKSVVEHRFYNIPADIPAILLEGDKWYISDKKSSRMHFHNCDEIGFCHSGEGTIEFDNGTSVSFKEGDCTFIPRHLPHTTYSVGGSSSLWSYIFVDFNVLLSDDLMHIAEGRDLSLDDIFRKNCVISRDVFPDVFSLCQLLLDEIRGRRDDWVLVFKPSAAALYYLIKRMYHTLSVASGISDFSVRQCFEVRVAIDYIQKHFADKIKVSDLAALCHLSENHFRRVFLAEMGTSPLSYINFIRINQACILLSTSNQSILSVAGNSGFNSIASFNRNFKNILGISPRDYRGRIAVKSDSTLYQKLIRTYNGWTEAEINPH
ncbi:MAG: AraC family transcriptional regulator [Oscillospiraceae bacterium]|nr:AraC family transcriptional regulator [Oscillospiraceae bacterium]